MEDFIVFVGFALAIATFAATIAAINLFVKAARGKGHYRDEGAGLLWFIGLFASPITLGLYVATLPDRTEQGTVSPVGEPPENALPQV